MLKNYIKIAYKVLLRRKFFTFISLFGISFTLLVVMVGVAFIAHMTTPAKPGSKFDRTLFTNLILIEGEDYSVESYPSYYLLNKYILSMESPEAISLYSNGNEANVYLDDRKLELTMKYTDAKFWDILEFPFLKGQPYTSDAVLNADHVAVITERTRQQVFGSEPAIGKYLETTSGNYRVIGVIPHEEITTSASNADIYVPLTTYRLAMSNDKLYGDFRAFILARDKSDYEIIKHEFEERLDQIREDYKGEVSSLEWSLGTQKDLIVDTIWGTDQAGGAFIAYMQIILVLVLFMLFPAINLININVSRIIERSSEIGVRKAFGASSQNLVVQFITENVFLTLLGGVIAIVLAFIALGVINDSGVVPYGILKLNLRVFFYSLLATMFFGIFSGILPAWKMSRLNAIDALRGGAA